MNVETLLLDGGLLSAGELADLRQRAGGERLDRAAVEAGLLDEDRWLSHVGDMLGLDVVDVSHAEVDRDLLNAFPTKAIFRHECLPLHRQNGHIVVAVGDPARLETLDDLSAASGFALKPVLGRKREVLEKIKDHRDQFTLFSGLSHPNQSGNNGHASELTWLTSAQRPGLAGFKNTVSLDQVMAKHLRGRTRVPHLALTTTHNSLSWTDSGVQIPAERSPSKVFKRLFIDGTEKEVAKELADLERGHSILDTVMEDAKRMEHKLSRKDREKLEQYFSSVRELEKSFEQSGEWATKPKPKVDV
ncbi:MAG: DUF1552 domain-containing protein, partial [Planctomycetota bacterium]